MENINDQLGKLDVWKDKACVDCGRKPAESRLSIEGVIHHATPLRCVDRKSCERIKRRQSGANDRAQATPPASVQSELDALRGDMTRSAWIAAKIKAARIPLPNAIGMAASCCAASEK